LLRRESCAKRLVQHILNASKVLKNADLISDDFEQILTSASTGDFVYLDPPYTVLHSQNSFRRYNEKLFSWADQVRLAKLANELAARGCLVVVSNAANPEVLELYPDFKHLNEITNRSHTNNVTARKA
jgi:DNA adenine methylase